MREKSDFPIGAILLMGAGALALVIIVAAATILAQRTSTLAAEVVQTRRARTASSDVLEALLNAETSQRGYLITQNERYLDPYNVARPTLKTDLSTLSGLESGNPAVKRALATLSIMVAAKMREMDDTIALAKSGQRDRALALVNSDRGITMMDNARAALRQVIDDAERVVTRDMKQLNTNALLLKWVTIVGGGVIVLFGIAAMWLVFQAIRQSVQAREQVVDLNATLEERVLRRTAALTRANDEIQRFAYIVSHDLRAPLVNIMGFTRELEVGADDLKTYFESETEEARPAAREAASDAIPEAVKFIRSSTAKMDRLINAILKLSREGRRELVAEQVDLNAMLENIVTTLRQQIDETESKVDITPDMPRLKTDRLALEQVLSNIIDNALKYLQQGRPGHIQIGYENARSSVIITIRDNGRGIAENDVERVFELFRRAGKQDRPGEGIGLAHVRALVRRLGGDITVLSKLGAGSEFRVLLPRVLIIETGTI
jgi:signal transduction histidine kinase